MEKKTKQRRKRRVATGARQFRLFIEPLEDRLMLATITVTSLADDTTVDGQVTLREAIHAANTNTSVDGSSEGNGADTIAFASDVFGSIQTIKLTLGELTITDSLTINGTGQDLLTIDAQQQSRIVNVFPGIARGDFDVTIAGLTLTGGRTTASNQVVDGSRESTHSGGAIRFNSTGTLSLVNSKISASSTAGDFADGGAIRSLGALSLTNSTVVGNRTEGDFATGGGLRVSGSLTLSNSAISGNNTAGVFSGGGGVTSLGTVTLTDSTVSENWTDGDSSGGGGIWSLLANSVTVIRSTVSDNQTAGESSSGGGISLTGPLVVTNSTISGNSTVGDRSVGGGVVTSSSITLTNSTISANRTGGDGGGILVFDTPNDHGLLIANSIIAGNAVTGSLAFGPDFLPDPDGTLAVTNSLIGNNSDTSLNGASIGLPDANGNLIGIASSPIDPKLGPLADNGGPTRTLALLPGSPAIDAGDPTAVAGQNGSPLIDQRGAMRVLNRLDIGAIEASIDPIVTWDTPADIAFGTSLSATQLNATADVNGTFVYTPSSGTQLDSGVNHQLRVTFTPNDSLSFNQVTTGVTINVLASDFGDAPAPYPTSLAESGARHLAVGPTLGNSRDAESDGTHSANANHDDVNSEDDEDGVTFGTVRVGQLDATATVNVQGGSARLDAWIDFNQDGSWGGAWEQIADNLLVQTGNNTIEFDVPSWAASGTTFARFRLSTAGNLGVGGEAADGEVEDYAVLVDSAKSGSGVFGNQNTISTAADYPSSVSVADLDGDGDLDVLSASFYDNTIAWYENDGNAVPTFTPHIISTEATGATSVSVADLDGDGHLDVLSALHNDNKIAWYKHNGSEFPTFSPHTISTADNRPRSLSVGDMDGDGDLDVLSALYVDNKIAWHENDGTEFPTFTTHTISTAAVGATSVSVADVDGDGDLDVLSTSEADDKIAWYENDGNAVPTFTTHIISTEANAASSVSVGDLDGDGDLDVLSASRVDNKIAWYENYGSEVPAFTTHTISTTANRPSSVSVADVDGDGDLDVLSASYDNIAWYENDGSEFPIFTIHTISTATDEASSVAVGDVDGDGDLDVLSTSAADDKIAWYAHNAKLTLAPLGALTISEDAPEQTLILANISAGGRTSQPLRVMASSSNTSLIPTPKVTYTSAETMGSLKFTPVADQSGTATIFVTVEDGGLDSDLDTTGDNATFSQTFDVTVNAVNDAPILDAIADTRTDEDADELIVSLSGIAAGGDESQSLQVTASSDNTSLIASPAVRYTSAQMTASLAIAPEADQSGTAVITVIVEDAGLDGDMNERTDNGTFQRTFTVTVNAVNDAPVAGPQSVTTDEHAALDVVLSGSDVDGDSLTFSLVNLPQHGTLSGDIPNFKYTPEANFHGQDTIVFTVSDEESTSPQATVSITVQPINDPPVANLQSVLVFANSQQQLTLTGSDVEQSELRFTIIDSPIWGTLSGELPHLTYTPIPYIVGVTDTFTFKVDDGVLESVPATVTLDIVSAEFPEPFKPIADRTISEDSGLVSESLWDRVAAGDFTVALTAESDNVSLIQHPDVQLGPNNATASISFQPARDASGTAVIHITLTTTSQLATRVFTQSFSKSFTVAVEPVNDPPVVANLQSATNEDTPIAIELPYSDLDGDDLSIQIITGDIQGIAAIVVDGSSRVLSYDPTGSDGLQELSRGESAEQSILLSIDDGNGGVETATVVITVHGVTDWQNPTTPLDANGDGEVSPVDALVIINSLNSDGSRALLPTLTDPSLWYDVNGDGFISPLDALLIINRLNASQSAGEAELSGTNEFVFDFPESSQRTVHRFAPARLRMPRAPSDDTQPHASVRDGHQVMPHYHPVELPKHTPHLQALDEFLANLDCEQFVAATLVQDP